MELIYLDHVEWYLGERVLRQFGIDQPVPDPPPQSFDASRTGGAARYSLLETLRDQIRHFNAGGDFFEMHLTDREDYVEWSASVSTGPILPPHMRIGSNYAIRGGQAASWIAKLRRDLDTIIRERDTSLSIIFLYGWLIDACRPPCF